PGAWEALDAAEGSDWFWWFGEDHHTRDKALFDRLFREHLQAVYERAQLPPPAWLGVPVMRTVRPPDRALQPLGFLHPELDGRPTVRARRGRRARAQPPVREDGSPLPGARCVIGSVVEIGIPFRSLGYAVGESLELILLIGPPGAPGETLPSDDLVRLAVPQE